MQEVKDLEGKMDKRFNRLEETFADYCKNINQRLEAGAKKLTQHDVEIDNLKHRDNLQNGHAKELNNSTGDRIGRVEKEVKELKSWIMGQLAAIILLGGGALIAFILK